MDTWRRSGGMDGPTYVDFVEFHEFELGGKSGKTSFVEGDGVVIVYFYGETRVKPISSQ